MNTLGLPLFDKNVIAALSMMKKPIRNFRHVIQDKNSKMCGLFCVTFLACDELNISFKQFASFFMEDNLRANDRICVEILKTFIMKN